MRSFRVSRSVLIRAAYLAAIGLFLATRLVFLDRDLPPWELAQYQPIDEFTYAAPAFNLHHYGSWSHQDVPYAPVEGSPMNILQSAVTAPLLGLDWSYWGFRASSVLFGLVAFGAMLATVRRLVRKAREDGVSLPFHPGVVLVASALLLLTDFSFLVAGRVVEPTIARLAVIAVLIWLVARGTFLGRVRTPARALAFGAVVGSAVCFVYVYNAFLVPATLLAVAWWAARDGTRRDAVRQVVLVAVGMAAAVVAYFVLVYLVFGLGPSGWYTTWVSPFRETGRAAALRLPAVYDVLAGNIFRLDRPFLLIALLVLPAFAWWVRRSRDPLGLFTLSLLLAFLAQCTIQSDYPSRKILVVLAMALPIAAGGILRAGDWLAWVRARRWRLAAAIGWVALVLAGTLLLVLPPGLTPWEALAPVLGLPSPRSLSYTEGTVGALVAGGALVGMVAGVLLLMAWRRTAVARIAAVVLLGAMLLPLAYVDRRYVFAHVTTTYRDAMIRSRPILDGQVTAGQLSFAMQLYNTGRPVFGMTSGVYTAAVVRYFAEGRASAMFGYADDATAADWASLGFRLVEKYAMALPKHRTMGRYVYDPGPGGAASP